MEGEEERKDTERSFSKASIPKRMAIVAAGGIVNIIFGLVLYFGIISFQQNNWSNIVEKVEENYSAQIAGIQNGDKILKINNKRIHIRSDLDEAIQRSNGEEISVQIERNGEKQEIKLKPTEIKTKSTGIYLSGMAEGNKATQIIQLDEKSNAYQKGMRTEDIITKVNGEEVLGNQEKLIELINQSEIGEEIEFMVDRNGEEQIISVLPDEISTYYLGTFMKKADKNLGSNIYYGFWETTDFMSSILDNVKMLFTGKVGINQMMGPVGISNVVSQTKSFQEFIYMLALISLSLGITNLLPIPALDGGKILLLVIEAIRRKPLKEEVEIGIQLLGFSILIVLSIFITYKDIIRIF